MEKKLWSRRCSVTGEGMNEGWVWGDGVFYTKYLEDTLKECRNDREYIIQDLYSLSAESANPNIRTIRASCQHWRCVDTSGKIWPYRYGPD
jgi:hypothetical protein